MNSRQEWLFGQLKFWIRLYDGMKMNLESDARYYEKTIAAFAKNNQKNVEALDLAIARLVEAKTGKKATKKDIYREKYSIYQELRRKDE